MSDRGRALSGPRTDDPFDLSDLQLDDINDGAGIRPRVFIGSSRAALPVARAIQVELEIDLDTTIGSQGVFTPSRNAGENLDQAVRDYDAAVIILTPEDLVATRGGLRAAPRDNALYELGLFVGALGRSRVFVIRPVETELDLPSDLLDLTLGRYRRRADGNLQAAVAPACTSVREAVHRLVTPQRDVRSAPKQGRVPAVYVPRPRRRRSLGAAVSSVPSGYHPIVNISETGALIETHGPLPVGRCMDLDLALDNGETVKVKAAVVRNQTPDWGRIGGVGVTFRDLDSNATEILRTYIDSDPTPVA